MRKENALLFGEENYAQYLLEAIKELDISLLRTDKNEDVIDLIDQYNIKLVLISENYLKKSFIEELRIRFPKGKLSITVVTDNDCIINALNLVSSDVDDCLYTKDFFLRLRISKILSDMHFIAHSIEKSQIDYLTNMYNRMSFHDLASRVCSISKYENTNICCAMIDIDHFKKINDTHGHLIGDEIIKQVASLIKTHFRKNDLVGRFGGEEFIVLMRDIARNKACELFEKLRRKIEDLHVYTDGLDLNITVSIGLYSGYCYELDALQSRADKLLYKAKNSGRNRLIC